MQSATTKSARVLGEVKVHFAHKIMICLMHIQTLEHVTITYGIKFFLLTRHTHHQTLFSMRVGLGTRLLHCILSILLVANSDTLEPNQMKLCTHYIYSGQCV